MRRLTTLAILATTMLTAAEPRKIFDYPYQQHDLPNGLRLITIPTDYPNIVALYIVVQTGSRNEVEPGKTGLRPPLRTHDVPRHGEISAGKYNQILQRGRRRLERLHQRRPHRLSHHLLQGRPGDNPGHGGRPLPDT